MQIIKKWQENKQSVYHIGGKVSWINRNLYAVIAVTLNNSKQITVKAYKSLWMANITNQTKQSLTTLMLTGY